jgi:hypothetical protein
MATMNLYLPAALKADMEACEGVNWSQVAQQAFLRTIEIERIKSVNITEAGLERLRSSRTSKLEMKVAAAIAAGKKWALEAAEYDELERVADLSTLDQWHWDGEPGVYGWGAEVINAIHGEGEWDRSTVEDFCEAHFGVGYPEGEEVEGFVSGAQEVFNEL